MARAILPTVTADQKAVSARDAAIVVGRRSPVQTSCDQLPLNVSITPYDTAMPAESQKRRGNRARTPSEGIQYGRGKPEPSAEARGDQQ